MKIILITAITISVLACHQSGHSGHQDLQNQIDSLRNKIAHAYSPGVGEFMSSIQMHHAKLWFAGKNENWDLANFEIEEIQESLDDIQQYCADSPSIKTLPMIFAPLDSVKHAISEKNTGRFKTSFNLLTNTCNSCHQASNRPFNVIRIPDTPPVSNQVFEKNNH
ncbi:MAG TPA: hypothetical protein VFI33_10065 [Puia sp.]|nr:hypothetical protein [Puia sp.]